MSRSRRLWALACQEEELTSMDDNLQGKFSYLYWTVTRLRFLNQLTSNGNSAKAPKDRQGETFVAFLNQSFSVRLLPALWYSNTAFPAHQHWRCPGEPTHTQPLFPTHSNIYSAYMECVLTSRVAQETCQDQSHFETTWDSKIIQAQIGRNMLLHNPISILDTC